MASKFGLAGGIPERKVRPIWDAIDSRQFKSALKHVTTLLTKHPNSPYALALKALVLERMGKPDEALSVALNAKDLLYGNDSLLMDDLTLSTLQIVFQRLDHLDLATGCYEHACSKFPSNLELMMGLFNCYVREYSFVKQQQTAIKMYKLVGEERFLLWAVCSIQLQVLCGNGEDKLLLLAEGLLKKHVASHSLHEPEALMIYISILERQAKFGDALEILSGKLGSLLMIEVDKLRMQGRLLARAIDYTAAADIFNKILDSCPDDWECFLHYLGCLLEDDSIWCDETVNDPVHLPKFVNCKVSHLTDEQFDSRISIASTRVQKLQADTVNNLIRCPYLATIEIERRNHLRGKGNDDNIMDGILQYFCRFGHLACFTSDVEIFVDVLTTDKKTELLEKLMKTSDTISAPPTKRLGLSISLFKIKQLLLGEMFKSSASVSINWYQSSDLGALNLFMVKPNTKMEARLEAVEKAIAENHTTLEATCKSLQENRAAMENALEENREAMDRRMNSMEDMLRNLVSAWEKQFPESGTRLDNSDGANSSSGTHVGNRWRTLEMPFFEGEDPIGWLTKIERYFRLQEVQEEEKLEVIVVAMEGEALGWFQWWESSNPNQSWEGFKIAISQRFQDSNLGNPFQALLALKQEGIVTDFIEQFEKYAGMIKGLEEAYLMEVFLKGLKEEISSEVRLHEPSNLMEVMIKARRVEDKNSTIEKLPTSAGKNFNLQRSNFNQRFVKDWQPTSNEGAETNQNNATGSNANKTGNRGWKGDRIFHNLSPAEVNEKMRKGESFTCEEKYNPAHVCKNKQFRLMIMEEEDDDGDPMEERREGTRF